MAALTRKKLLEKDLDKWTNTKNTIEQQVFTLENANINLETMKAMKSGADAMKGIHGSLYCLTIRIRANGRSPEKVDTIMDDIRDQMAVSNEISEAIARPALGTDIDEDELREELEQLEQEELDTKLVGVDVPSQRMPTAPERRIPLAEAYLTAEPVQKQKTKEEENDKAELRALQAEMAI
jgi:charged multivesicular body protein 4A/B